MTDYKCEDCRNENRPNFCQACLYISLPSGKNSKPTLWEPKREEIPIALAIAENVAKGEEVPQEWIDEYKRLKGET